MQLQTLYYRFLLLSLAVLLVFATGPAPVAAQSIGGEVGTQMMTGSVVMSEGETASGLDVIAGTVLI